MKKLFVAAVICGILPLSAFANTYVQCGKFVDLEAGKVTGYELEISSENDLYSGPVGKNWNLKLNQNADWLTVNPKITAKSSKNAEDRTVIEITLKQAESVTGAVGIQYKLIDLYSDEPTLEKYTMGGFAGSVRIATFKCQSAND